MLRGWAILSTKCDRQINVTLIVVAMVDVWVVRMTVEHFPMYMGVTVRFLAVSMPVVCIVDVSVVML
jgi:hypothetical protein